MASELVIMYKDKEDKIAMQRVDNAPYLSGEEQHLTYATGYLFREQIEFKKIIEIANHTIIYSEAEASLTALKGLYGSVAK